jgi:SpoVK/Ycf46/Vps4 family AAA+-type ATPase
MGLTSLEAENAFSISLVEAKKYDEKIIRREKASVVKKSGLLEIIDTDITLDDIGGNENVKTWLTSRAKCFGEGALKFGIKPPKGMLLVGVQGCGKSLTAKAVAAAWNRTLLRLDMGQVLDKFVGESERNFRKCLETASAIAPVCLWIDESEKGLAGNKAGGDSHETSKKIFATLLTWMQERLADVFVFFTAASLEGLPPDLLRAGRVDAIFWLDLPDEIQREEILKIHLKKVGRNPGMFDKHMPKLMKACEEFTGAEIETWVQVALIRALNEGHEDLTLEDMLVASKEITTIACLGKVEIDNARKYALMRGAKNASIIHTPQQQEPGKRKVSLN